MKSGMLLTLGAASAFLLASCSGTIHENEQIYLKKDATLTPVVAPTNMRRHMRSSYPVPKYNQQDQSQPSLLPPDKKLKAYRKEYLANKSHSGQDVES